MIKETDYIFTSARLGFRNWHNTDLEKMFEICKDEKVMEFFPTTLTEQQTSDFVQRMKIQFEEKQFTYFAVELLESKEFIGFIGLSEQTYPADFTPCIDIGWRLKQTVWNQGYATEGAKRCLKYGFEHLDLRVVYAVAPSINKKSEKVMEKIGLHKVCEFSHPLLMNDDRLRNCVLYKRTKTPLYNMNY